VTTARPGPALAVAALVLGLVVAGPGPTAEAAESYVVPAEGLTITGHGYGHGRGMGQYGAQGAALQGVPYRDILGHYYPGTVVGPLPGPPTVRVLLTGDTDDDVTVRADPGLALTDADGARWELPAGPTAWRVRADPAGVQRVELLAGAWQPWVAPGGRSTFGRVSFGGPSRVRVDLPGGGGRAYRGTVTAAGAGGSALDTVNTVLFEQYLWSVVPRESPASWAPAALQAQAVAARTYAAFERRAAPARSYDLCDTTACQVYGGSASYTDSGALTEQEFASTTAAVNATAGEVRLYGGQPAFTQFSASTGGWTAAGGQPYLVAGPDPWDAHPGNPVHTWTATLTPAALAAAYPAVGAVRSLVVTGRDGGGEWGGRTTSLVLQGVSPSGAPTSLTVTGTDLASRLQLRSPWWVGTPASPAAIHQHWLHLGGEASFLGRATGPEHDVPGGRAQDFQGGSIFWSPATGPHEVHGLILARYLALGGPGGLLGLPTTDEKDHVGGRRSGFTGGVVHWSAATGAQAVHGRVLAAYRRLGEAAGVLGRPVTEELPVPGGLVQRFTLGDVYWSAATDAHEVHGSIRGRYDALGGPGGLLGLPVADEVAAAGGRRGDFQGGRVYWTEATGAHEVHGRILQRYRSLGAAGGSLGPPVSDEYAVPGGRRSDFVAGALVWDAATDRVFRVRR
jgi:peptidoglycan hydrolase-like amidase